MEKTPEYLQSQGWKLGKAVCLSCLNEWTAAIESSPESLECPVCHEQNSLFVEID